MEPEEEGIQEILALNELFKFRKLCNAGELHS